MSDFIFHDPTGRRARRANFGVGLLVSFAALLVAAFFATLAFAPRLPSVTMKDPRVLQALHPETAHRFRRPAEWRRVPQPVRTPTGRDVRPLSVGFYVSWDESSRVSLRRHVNQLDVISPQWVLLDGSRGAVSVTSDPVAEAMIATAKTPPSVLPMVHNGHDAASDQILGSQFLMDTGAQTVLIDNLVTLAQQRGWAGYVFDLENLSKPALARYPVFLARARAALKTIGREAWVAVPFGDNAWPVRRFAAVSDSVVLMAYDQHWGGGVPGPVAAQDWFQQTLAADMRQLNPAHTIIALGAHGYDWTLADAKGPASAHAVGFYDATQAAHDSGAAVSLDDDSLNPTYGYVDDDGRKHTVWFLDVATFFNEMKVADAYRPQGYAIWRMGAEDPSDWIYMRGAYGSERPLGLTNIIASVGVDFDGTGEILHVDASPTNGRRTIETDADTGLISGESYEVMPTSYVIDRYGWRPGWVALTFDDGPDGRWTPRILKILEQKHATATFFVIGENMQKKPALVQREVRDGDMVGNHTWTHPNIAVTPLAQDDLEINTTQRLFQVLTGRSMRLFRPPYFGDAEPSTPGEVDPLLIAQRLGYLIVGLRVDTDDWRKPPPAEIIKRTLDGLAKQGEFAGQVVLLHDAGGDRSRTVAALPGLIDAIRARGYTLVTVDQLAGMSRADALPPTSRSSVSLFLDRLGFGFFRYLNEAMQALFTVAIVLGVLRLAFLAVLALVHRFREPGREPAMGDPDTGPLISVLIPCFNEEKVIVQSVGRILASHWKNIEILVLDDGSKDRTSDVVREAYEHEPRVQLLTFENGGKARALNRGLALTRGEIIVALDADTLFPPDTLGRLSRWFADERVGAVAGNAVVGNRLNLITRWQALEYVTAQNLERRALAALGAVTVVPGAVGAWRRSVLLELGGYPHDTLAEDQDLTLAVQRAGWRVEFDSSARAYTEAPDTVRGLLNQRFRWSFGTLQCLWKHRDGLFNTQRPVLGFVALPQIWLFQIFLTVAAPLVDLAIVSSLVWALYGRAFHPVEWSPDDFLRSVFYWAAFIFLDLSAGALGMALERRAPWRDLVWLPVQRFGYRQLMYYVVVKSVSSAIRGYRVGWGKLERRATVVVGRAA
ncbi:MAG TPA: glycosyltransferase [Caulobacteraceae bacterium]|jgi:cellulose synthase/poly-beta-1,6-N-acetylglucosamine synthase-like glycosyltransferase/spore germination protein YaaH/peptidoglycan/xylan/chitin deacetylase (PgdA/CDA1 family)|nr:glycosyltransferase [Caulobacteraceae bacterium]